MLMVRSPGSLLKKCGSTTMKTPSIFLFQNGESSFLSFCFITQENKRFLVFESLKPKVSLKKPSIHSAGRYCCSTDRYLCAILNLADLGTKTSKTGISLEIRVGSACFAKMLSTATSKMSLRFLYCNFLDTQGAQPSQGNNAASTDLSIINSF